MRVDAMKLAYQAFMGYRHLIDHRDAVLALLIDVLTEVERSGMLAGEIPDDVLSKFPFLRECEVRGAEVASLQQTGEARSVVDLIEVAAHEFLRLGRGGLDGAQRSLGYAMHSVPEVIGRQEEFDPSLFMFSLRIAAFHWHELSDEMRNALASVARLETGEIDRLVQQDGFVIDMFPIR